RVGVAGEPRGGLRVGLLAQLVAELGEAPAEQLAVAGLAGRDEAERGGQLLVVGGVRPRRQIVAGLGLGERDGVQEAQVGWLVGGLGRRHRGFLEVRRGSGAAALKYS